MNRFLAIASTAFFISSFGNPSLADGELNLFNWGDYTSPELIEKFENQYNVSVTITDYDSNATALAKIKAGGHGFDLVVPSANYVQIWVQEGLLLESRPDQMENFKYVKKQFSDPVWDPGRRYTAPWLWGSFGVGVDTSIYGGNINTSEIVFYPPEELSGKINVPPEMNDVIKTALLYLGGDTCTDDKEMLRKVRDMLVEAKPKWLSMDYGMTEKLGAKDVAASLYWNGAVFRAKQENPDLSYGYPQEGYLLWMDSVAVLADAKNIENAKLFQNFIMAPENAALISTFAKYANGIEGSEEFMPDNMKGALEIEAPEELAGSGQFSEACSPDITKMYTAIWTELQK